VNISQKALGGYFFDSPCTHLRIYAAKNNTRFANIAESLLLEINCAIASDVIPSYCKRTQFTSFAAVSWNAAASKSLHGEDLAAASSVEARLTYTLQH